MRQRFTQLDSLRGLAAISVLLSHYWNVFPLFADDIHKMHGLLWLKAVRYTPLRIIYAGHEAVVFFFVLSGFVLSLPYLSSTNQPYVSFAIKRICRIWIPYIIAIATAVVLSVLLPIRHSGMLSSWVNSLNWNSRPSLGIILSHVFVIGNFNTDAYDTVIWSLVHEMRISLIFPLLMYSVLRWDWKTNIGVWFTVSLVSIFIPSFGSLTLTLHYVFMFVGGALLAKHVQRLVGLYQKRWLGVKLILFAAAVLLYGYAHIPGWLTGSIDPTGERTKLMTDWLNTSGAALFVVVGLSTGWFNRFLLLSPVAYLGKVSYSIYLFHFIALLTMLNIFNSTVNIWVILAVSFAVTLVISHLSYRFIESPAISLGRYLTRRRDSTTQATVSA